MTEDLFLEKMPVVGKFFERTYEFWRTHIAIANLTHFALGFGLALLLFSRYKKIGPIFVVLTLIMHVVAFVK